MIIDTFLNIIFGFVTGFLALLPSMTLLPESFNDAWTFIAESFATFLWVLDPTVASFIVVGMQVVIYLYMVMFMVYLFSWLWGLIRG